MHPLTLTQKHIEQDHAIEFVIARSACGEAIQSSLAAPLDCFASFAMTGSQSAFAQEQ
jgi:hypothetical protein